MKIVIKSEIGASLPKNRYFVATKLTSIILVATLLTLGLTSCDKKEAAQGGAPSDKTAPAAPKTSLLDKLPSSTVFFSYMDSTTPAAAKYRSSVIGKIGDKIAELSTSVASPAGGSDGAKQVLPPLALLDAQKKSGLFFGGQGAPAYKEWLYFSAQEKGYSPGDVVHFYTAADGTDLTKKVPEIEAAFKTAGFDVKPGGEPNSLAITGPKPAPAAVNSSSSDPSSTGAGAGDDFAAEKPEAPKAPDFSAMGFYVKATTNLLAIAPKAELAAPLFSEGAAGFTATPKYAAAKAYFPSDLSKVVGIGYFDIEKTASMVSNFVPADQSPVPLTEVSKDLPFTFIAGAITMDSNPAFEYVAPITTKNDTQKQVLEALKKLDSKFEVGSVPEQALFVLALNGAVPAEIAKVTKQELGDPNTASMLGSLKTAVLGVANAAGASPFPDLFFTARTNQPDQLLAAAKAGVSFGAAAGGMPPMEWSSKKIGGADVDFMPSPLGMGLYIGKSGDAAFATSSEQMAESLVTASAPSKATAAKLSALMTHKGTPLLGMFISGPKLFELLQSLKDTLAMFTGGNTSFDPSQYELLKELEAGAVTVSLDGDVIRAHGDLVQKVAK